MVDDSITKKLYKSISDANEVRVYEHWHASSMGECPRSHYFKRLGIPALNVPTAAKMLRWQAGHLIEEVIRPHLLKLYPDLVSNRRFTSKALDLTGEFDNYSAEAKTLIEVKSVHVFAPKNIEKEGKPYLGHEYQNHSYKLLMEEEGLEVEHIVYIYIALDGRIIVINTQVQEHILDGLRKRLEVLKKGLEGELPPCFCYKEHPLYKSVAQYCDYKDEKKGVCCEVPEGVKV